MENHSIAKRLYTSMDQIYQKKAPPIDPILDAIGVSFGFKRFAHSDYMIFGRKQEFSYWVPQKGLLIDLLQGGFRQNEIDYKEKRAAELGHVYIAIYPGEKFTYDEIVQLIDKKSMEALDKLEAAKAPSDQTPAVEVNATVAPASTVAPTKKKIGRPAGTKKEKNLAKK